MPISANGRNPTQASLQKVLEMLRCVNMTFQQHHTFTDRPDAGARFSEQTKLVQNAFPVGAPHLPPPSRCARPCGSWVSAPGRTSCPGCSRERRCSRLSRCPSLPCSHGHFCPLRMAPCCCSSWSPSLAAKWAWRSRCLLSSPRYRSAMWLFSGAASRHHR